MKAQKVAYKRQAGWKGKNLKHFTGHTTVVHKTVGQPTPQLVLLSTDGVDSEGVRVLVTRGDDGPCQREHAAGLLGPGLLIDKVL